MCISVIIGEVNIYFPCALLLLQNAYSYNLLIYLLEYLFLIIDFLWYHYT